LDPARRVRNRRSGPAVHDPEGFSIAIAEKASGSWKYRRWNRLGSMIMSAGAGLVVTEW